jgi:phenylacetate-CoA ligase
MASDVHAPATHSFVERMPADELRQLQSERLVAQLQYLMRSSLFYQRKMAKENVVLADVKDVGDLDRVPFTIKQELRDSLAAAPPFGEHLASSPRDLVQMQASSGTTGSPSYVALTASDLQQWTDMAARSLFAAGLRRGDRVLHGFSMSKGFVGGIPMFQGAQELGALDIPIGADGGIDRLLVACRELRPECIMATPNFLSYMAEVAPATIGISARDLGVRRLIVGGEPGGSIPALRQKLQEDWGAKSCEMLGGTDLGVVFFAECDHQRGMHMVAPDYVLVELIDPGSGSAVPFEGGARGEMVYTALGRQASPLLRFRSGDHVEVLDTQCPCGRTGPLIRCVGRTDDMLIVRGVNLFPSAVQDVVAELRPRVTGVMRIFADFAGHSTQGNLKVLVERGEHAPGSEDEDLVNELERRLRARLSVKTDIAIVDANTFEKPGAKKVSLTLREMPQLSNN